MNIREYINWMQEVNKEDLDRVLLMAEDDEELESHDLKEIYVVYSEIKDEFRIGKRDDEDTISLI